MKFQSFFSVLFILAVFVFLPSIINAQPGTPGGPPTPVGAPFDGGLSLIIAAGAGYALKKKYNQRKKQKSEQKEAYK